MRRIGLAVVLALSLLAVPLAGAAQQARKVPRIGYLVLSPLSDVPSPERAAFLAGLQELGWIEGKTIAIVYRSAQSNPEVLDDLAEELARMKVDVIVTAGSNALLRAAARATSTIPIVMPGSTDAVAEGFVATLARPGGNVTGRSSMGPELGSKRLELLKEDYSAGPQGGRPLESARERRRSRTTGNAGQGPQAESDAQAPGGAERRRHGFPSTRCRNTCP